ncbi:MAG: sialidase family protein, partial [Ilumatobacteraceae bacterium]
DPDHVLYGTQREGLWSSTDAGATWRQVPAGQVPVGVLGNIESDQAGVSTVAFAGGRQYAGVAGEGVYASDDGGTWQLERPVSAVQYPSGAIAVGNELWVSVNSTTDPPSTIAVRATDGEWRDLSLPFNSYFVSFAVDPAAPDHIVLADEAVRDGHLWSSDDGGDTWRTHDIAISAPDIPWLEATDLAGFMSTGRLMFDPAGSTLWFAEGMAVWRADSFDDDEVTWVATANGIEETVTSAFVVPPAGTPVAVVADRQGFLLDDLARPPQRTLIDTSFVGGTSLDFSGGNPQVLAWVGAEYHLYFDPSREARGALSTDGGRTWQQFSGLDLAQFGGEVAVSATDPNVLVWAPSYFADPGEYTRAPVGLWLSGDGGQQWERLPDVNGVSSFHRLVWWFTRRALAADRVDGRFYMMSDEGRFFVSADDGHTWEEGQSPPCVEATACHVFGQVQAMPGAAGHLWASTGSGGMFRSNDAGATEWQRVEGLAEARAFGFGAAIEPRGPLAIYVHGRADTDDTLGVYRSVDDGATWQRIADHPGGLPAGINVVAGDPDVPGRVYIGFAGAGFVRGDPAE